MRDKKGVEGFDLSDVVAGLNTTAHTLGDIKFELETHLGTGPVGVAQQITGPMGYNPEDVCNAHTMAELIAFQFPNTGTRRAVHGRTDNHILLRRFLRAAASRLKLTGRIAVTLVISPHYLGAIDPTAAAEWAGCEVVEVLPFYRSWSGYGHVNTNDASESALSKYRSCSTWVFKPVRR